MTAKEENLKPQDDDRERKISEKIARIRAQNVQWQQRHLEIEMDRNQAEDCGMAINRNQNRYIYKSPNDSNGFAGRGKKNKARFQSHNRPLSSSNQEGDSRPASQGPNPYPSGHYKEGGKSPRYTQSKHNNWEDDYRSHHVSQQDNHDYKPSHFHYDQQQFNGDIPVRLRHAGSRTKSAEAYNHYYHSNRHTWYGDQFNGPQYVENGHSSKRNYGAKYEDNGGATGNNLNESNAFVGIVRPRTNRRRGGGGGNRRGQQNRKSWCDPNDLPNQEEKQPDSCEIPSASKQSVEKQNRRKTWYCETRDANDEDENTLTLGSQSILSSGLSVLPVPAVKNDPTLNSSQASEASTDSKITSTAPAATSSNSIDITNTADTASSIRVTAANESTQHNNAVSNHNPLKSSNQKLALPSNSNQRHRNSPRDVHRRSDCNENWRHKSPGSWRDASYQDSYNSFNGPPRGRGMPRGRGWGIPRGRGRGNGPRQFYSRSSSLSLENLSRLSPCSDVSGNTRPYRNRQRGGRGNAPIYKPPQRRQKCKPSQEQEIEDGSTSVSNHPRNPLDGIDDEPKISELDDEYIDDTLEDLDQYRLKIDLIDFIVDNPVHPDPILSRPLTSWHSQIFSDQDYYDRHTSLFNGNASEQTGSVAGRDNVEAASGCCRTEESEDCGYRSNEHVDDSLSPPDSTAGEKLSSMSKRASSYLTLVWDDSTCGNAPIPNDNSSTQ